MRLGSLSMRVLMLRDRITLVPEGIADEMYLEAVLQIEKGLQPSAVARREGYTEGKAWGSVVFYGVAGDVGTVK